MFSPLDILYIVLAFCAMWLTAAIFWLLWQAAIMLKNINEVVSEGKEVMYKAEEALTGIRRRFEDASSLFGVVAETASKAIDYMVTRKEPKKRKKKSKIVDVG